MKYLALGDSYTYGEKVPPIYSFPYQLVQELRAQNVAVEAPEVVAMTAWTSADLRQHLESYNTLKNYNLCSLLIGVNNQYRGMPIDTFRQDLDKLTDFALQKVEQNSTAVLLLSIPDWGLTPYNKDRNKAEVSQEIDLYNEIIKQKSQEIDCLFVDICSLSREHADQAVYLVDDGLHPSAEAYKSWVNKILTQTLNLGEVFASK